MISESFFSGGIDSIIELTTKSLY